MLCNWMQMGVYSKIGGLLHQHSLLRNINQNLVVSVHGISVTVAPSYHLILKSHCSVVWFPVGQVRLRSTLPALMLNIIHNFCGVGNMLWIWHWVAAYVLYSAVFDSCGGDIQSTSSSTYQSCTLALWFGWVRSNGLSGFLFYSHPYTFWDIVKTP